MKSFSPSFIFSNISKYFFIESFSDLLDNSLYTLHIFVKIFSLYHTESFFKSFFKFSKKLLSNKSSSNFSFSSIIKFLPFFIIFSSIFRYFFIKSFSLFLCSLYFSNKSLFLQFFEFFFKLFSKFSFNFFSTKAFKSFLYNLLYTLRILGKILISYHFECFSFIISQLFIFSTSIFIIFSPLHLQNLKIYNFITFFFS